MLKDYEKMVNHCAREGACRVAPRSNMAHCPSGKKFGFDSYYQVGKMEIARSLIRGELEWSSKVAVEYIAAFCVNIVIPSAIRRWR